MRRRRIIPAYAGPTWSPDKIRRAKADHPRVCGANACIAAGLDPLTGSSPRMRGQPPRCGRRSGCGPDHPRVCGANWHCRSPFAHLVGSSPRMRGQRGRAPIQRLPRRIIPAYAGPTPLRGMRMARTTDHPRVCGANAAELLTQGTDGGSSPRMRGQQSYFMREIGRGASENIRFVHRAIAQSA